MKGKIVERLEVLDIAEDGKSLARHNGLVIFIDKALPGDVVDVLITRKHSSYLEGRAVHLHSPSVHRTEPFCRHFGICGGCKWQHMKYEAQLYYKQKQVSDAMERIAKLPGIPVSEIIPSGLTKYYRNKLDYSFADKKWLPEDQVAEMNIYKGPALGYHLPRRFDRILDIQECYLQPDPSDSIRNAVKKFATDNDLTFINLRHRAGLLRSLVIRNTLKGEWMVLVIVYENDQQQLNALLEHLADSFPLITSLLYVVNPKANDTFHDLPVHVYKGKDYITEDMDGLQFRIAAKSFFQTNPTQTLNLYRIAREFASLTGSETVYDLYTGTGTIANYVARDCRQVIGIDYVEDAIKDAEINSRINEITNTVFLSGDMRDLVTVDLFEKYGRADVIITDPPRAGMHYDVVERLALSEAKRIVYISCNPATQARDLQLLSERYSVSALQPVDMFPHTAHVENIALLNRIRQE
jgi:23S rRNA (uracil1939-C5)-methyltransferase